MTKHILTYIPCPSHSEAEDIARELIQHKLIACANIMSGHTAIYEWEGKIVKDEEVLLLAKTVKSKFDEVQKLVEKQHSYDLPCIIAIDICNANPSFLTWIEDCVK